MSESLTWTFSVIAAVMLFLHGLEAFSRELTELGGERLRGLLRRLTGRDWSAALTGAVGTALLQSSSAVTSMAVALADKQTIAARATLGVMIGANVGTTLTAWLVALKVPGLGPIFISIGGLLSLAGPQRWRAQGKVLFYFGLIFLALDLVSQTLAPLASHPLAEAARAELSLPWLALLFGLVLAAVVQSSSVVSGLAVLGVGQGLLELQSAVWLVAGANVGTSSTALLASAGLGPLARRLAICNSALNVMGVLLFATVLPPVVDQVLAMAVSDGERVALVHTLFNVAAATFGLLLLPLSWRWLARWLKV